MNKIVYTMSDNQKIVAKIEKDKRAKVEPKAFAISLPKDLVEALKNQTKKGKK